MAATIAAELEATGKRDTSAFQTFDAGKIGHGRGGAVGAGAAGDTSEAVAAGPDADAARDGDSGPVVLASGIDESVAAPKVAESVPSPEPDAPAAAMSMPSADPAEDFANGPT
jgi:hypothetical protein